RGAQPPRIGERDPCFQVGGRELARIPERFPDTPDLGRGDIPRAARRVERAPEEPHRLGMRELALRLFTCDPRIAPRFRVDTGEMEVQREQRSVVAGLSASFDLLTDALVDAATATEGE